MHIQGMQVPARVMVLSTTPLFEVYYFSNVNDLFQILSYTRHVLRYHLHPQTPHSSLRSTSPLGRNDQDFAASISRAKYVALLVLLFRFVIDLTRLTSESFLSTLLAMAGGAGLFIRGGVYAFPEVERFSSRTGSRNEHVVRRWRTGLVMGC